MRKPRRGDVWLVNCDPTLGAEIRKTRPALILQNDVSNEHSPITIVAAITSTPRLTPTRVHVAATESGLRVDSVVVLNQIRSVGRHLKTGHHSGGCRATCSRQTSPAMTAHVEVAAELLGSLDGSPNSDAVTGSGGHQAGGSPRLWPVLDDDLDVIAK